MGPSDKGKTFDIPIPETSAVVAGLGGLPCVMMLVTPLRNALTVGANNPSYSTLQCYSRVFASGPFKGGVNMMMGSVPASVAMGPAYHMFNQMSGGNGAFACGMAGICESAILYAPETRNAQLAFHGTTSQGLLPWGPGIGYHISRNILSMSGLRVFGEPTYRVCEPLVGQSFDKTTLRIFSDLVCNIIVSALSTPLHMAYTWKATNLGDTKGVVDILRHQWVENGRLRPTVGRDIFLRVAYNASIFTLYGAVERTVIAAWPRFFP